MYFFQLCAVATAKLHTLVQTKLISSSAEASFLIGNLNLMVLKAVRGMQRFTLIYICLSFYLFHIPKIKMFYYV